MAGAEASSSSGGGAAGGAVLQARVRRLCEVAERLDRARSGGRFVRALIFILLVVVVLSAGLRIYGMYQEVDRNLHKYQVAVMREMAVLVPKVGESLRQVAMRVAPDFRQAIENDLRAHKDEILKTLEKERDLFFANAAENLKKGLKTSLEQTVKRQEARLGKTFPKLQDAQTRAVVLDNITFALAESSGRFVERHFKTSLGLVAEIHEETILLLPDKESQARMRASTEQLFRRIEKAVMPPKGT